VTESRDIERDRIDLLDLLEGRLDEARATAFRERLASDPAYKAEYVYLQRLSEDLEEISDQMTYHLEDIDVVDDVLKTVEAMRPTEPGPADQPRRAPIWLWAAAAVAALILAVFLLRREVVEAPGPGPTIAKDDAASPVPDSGGDNRVLETPRRGIFELRSEWLNAQRRTRDREPNVGMPNDSGMVGIQLAQIIDARLKSSTDIEARAQLYHWARLTAAQAETVIARGDVSPGAKAAAAQALSDERRRAVLEAAVAQLPNDPALRVALLDAYGDAPELAEARTAEIDALRELDPTNALPEYLAAREYFSAGAVDNALLAMKQAASLDTVTAYSVDAAARRQEALIAAGMDQTTATLLSATTAGMDEYDLLAELGESLLEGGTNLADAGDTEGGGDVYEGVLDLGEQIDEGALLTEESLAGLELQMDALTMLEALLSQQGDAEGLAGLAQQALGLATQIQNLEALIAGIDDLFGSSTDTGFWGFLADSILDDGDLGLLSRVL
jgi:hypothetical protein